ncbi:dodecenoyl-CoA delta-isomerase [Aphomia sociella]
MGDGETIIEYRKGSVLVICFNKPKKKNAIDGNMYAKVTEIFKRATEDDHITAVMITGTGNFYSSGNDLSHVVKSDEEYYHSMEVLRQYIEAFIIFPKILIALVNGPAIGIAATTLALCDLVLASENSYFYTPFTRLGLVAEGCSTFTFPRLIGERKAKEMLLFNYKLSAKEALECGFVNCVYKDEELHNKAWEKINEIAEMSLTSILITKRLMKDQIREHLLITNNKEAAELKKLRTTAPINFKTTNSKL